MQIDEYQDTNGQQFRLIEGLVGPHRNLCVVGDDDQAIYGWRGAEVSHILSFANQFPDAKVVRLEENYRCTRPILEAANRLVGRNRERHRKTLRSNRDSTDDVRYLAFPDGQTEAEKVVLEIKFLSERKGVSLRDIAILFRTNEQPRLFESELRRAGVRYVMMGTQSFYDRREVRDLLAYLKVLSRPSDEASLLRILNTPARGISRTTAERALKEAVSAGVTFWEAALRCRASGGIPAKAAAAVAAFQELLERHRAQFAAQPRRMDESLPALITEIGYDAELERLYPQPQQRVVREASVSEVVQSLSEYSARSPQPSLSGYLSDTALDAREEEPDKDETAAQDAVKLLTLHSAKGLEFPRVYLVGMEEGLLPHKRSVDATDREIEEERRLAYVGVTRRSTT